MKKPNLPIIILCLAICVSGIAALSLKTFHTVNSTTSPYLLYLKVLQGNQQFYNVEFFVDKLPATQAAFETAVSQQGFKENVTWYNFTDDNLSLLTQQ